MMTALELSARRLLTSGRMLEHALHGQPHAWRALAVGKGGCRHFPLELQVLDDRIVLTGYLKEPGFVISGAEIWYRETMLDFRLFSPGQAQRSPFRLSFTVHAADREIAA
jgi:hypothetical protein